MGIQLLAFVCHVALAGAAVATPAPPGLASVLGAGGAAAVWGARRAAAAVLVAGVFGLATAGFWYWGAPYAYGLPLTAEQHAARKWLPTW
jgi:dolichyl-phosphate-mannose--protein O-mannosyl transferase